MRAVFSILAVLLCTANHCSRHGSLVQGDRFETKQHHFVPLLPNAATSGGGIAWLIQTGAATAREAVVAMLLTTLQNQHNRTGLVADVESEDVIPLADTGHQVETWSQQHWAAEVAKADRLDPDTSGKEIQFIAQTHPHYYQHWAHKVLAGFESAYTRCHIPSAAIHLAQLVLHLLFLLIYL